MSQVQLTDKTDTVAAFDDHWHVPKCLWAVKLKGIVSTNVALNTFMANRAKSVVSDPRVIFFIFCFPMNNLGPNSATHILDEPCKIQKFHIIL